MQLGSRFCILVLRMIFQQLLLLKRLDLEDMHLLMRFRPLLRPGEVSHDILVSQHGCARRRYCAHHIRAHTSIKCSPSLLFEYCLKCVRHTVIPQSIAISIRFWGYLDLLFRRLRAVAVMRIAL